MESLWWHRISGCHFRYSVSDVIEHSACDIINNAVGSHKMWTWCFIQCKLYYRYSECDVLYTKGVISLKVWMWWHTFSAVMSYTMDMMSSYIADEITKIQLVWYHQCIACDDIDTVDTMSNIVGVRSQNLCFDVIKWGCEVWYSAKDAIHYPSLMSYRVWVMLSMEWEWWHRLVAVMSHV